MLAWFMPGTVWPTLTLLGRVFIDCDMTRFEVEDILEAVAVNEVGAELCTTCPGPASGIELVIDVTPETEDAIPLDIMFESIGVPPIDESPIEVPPASACRAWATSFRILTLAAAAPTGHSHCLQSFPAKQKWVKKFEGSEQVVVKQHEGLMEHV
nr:hypothetical protein B296_00001770 [Ipomoea batatas]